MARRRAAVLILLVSAYSPGAPAAPADGVAARAVAARRDAGRGAHAAGPAYDEMTTEQKRFVDGGGQVFVARDVAGSPWPAVVVYQRIDATPEAAAAVFIDYERHRTYIPGVRRARVSRVVDPATVEVDYVLSVPMFPDEHYTVRNHLGTYEGGGYRVEWSLVRASSTRATTGQVRFEPHPDTAGGPGTVMAYSNSVTPGSRLARVGFIKARAMRQMRETASAIVKRVEAERASEPALLNGQIDALRAALGS
jgi:hypothetical protein